MEPVWIVVRIESECAMRFCCATQYSKIMTISHSTLSCIYQRNDFGTEQRKEKKKKKKKPRDTTDHNIKRTVWYCEYIRFVQVDVVVEVDFYLNFFLSFRLLNFLHFNLCESIDIDIFCIVSMLIRALTTMSVAWVNGLLMRDS